MPTAGAAMTLARTGTSPVLTVAVAADTEGSDEALAISPAAMAAETLDGEIILPLDIA